MRAAWTAILLAGVCASACSSGDELALGEVATEVSVSPTLKHLVVKNEIRNTGSAAARLDRFVRSCSCQSLTLDGEPLREGSVVEPGQSGTLRLELGSHSVNTLHEVRLDFGADRLTWRVRVRVDYDIDAFAPTEDVALAIGETRQVPIRLEDTTGTATTVHLTSRSDAEAEGAKTFVLAGAGEYFVTLRGHREGRKIRRFDFRSEDGRTVRPVILRWRVADGLRAQPSIVAARRGDFARGFEREIVLRRHAGPDAGHRAWSLELETNAPGLRAELVAEKPGADPSLRSVVVRFASKTADGAVGRGALLLRDGTSGEKASIEVYPAH